VVTHVQQLAHMGQRSEVFKNVAAEATARAQWVEAHLEHSKLEQILRHRQECQEIKLKHDAGKSQVKDVLQQHVAALKDMKGVVESAQRETLLSRKLWNAALAVKKRGTGLNYEGIQRGGKKCERCPQSIWEHDEDALYTHALAGSPPCMRLQTRVPTRTCPRRQEVLQGSLGNNPLSVPQTLRGHVLAGVHTARGNAIAANVVRRCFACTVGARLTASNAWTPAQ